MKIFIIITIIIILLLVAFYIFSNNSNNAKDKSQSKNIEEKNIQVESENSNVMEENMNSQNEIIKINLNINNKKFTATLNNNETVRNLVSKLPLTLNMQDLNSNEKYKYLDFNLPTNSNKVNRINAGDIKLFGNNCLVIFYESFNTSYSYTNLGKIDNVDQFALELGSGNVTITFEK